MNEDATSFSSPNFMAQYIQDTIRNNLRGVVASCSVPQQKAIHEIVRGLFTAHTPILRHLAQNPALGTKKQAEKYAHHLGNVHLTPAIEAHAVRRIRRTVTDETIIAYDLSDIAKPHAQVMENIQTVFDGSARKPAPGFTLHGVGVDDMLLKFAVHHHATHTLNQTRRSIVEELSAAFGGKGIWVFDRGNDDKAFFVWLRHVQKLSFVARLKKNRQVVLAETGEQMLVENMAPGTYLVFLMNKNNNAVDRRGTYTLIIHNHLPDRQPIRLLSSIPPNKHTAQEFVTIYLQRWGVESSFRRAKQKFQLERIRVLSAQKFANLVALIQFAVNVSRILFLALQHVTNTAIVHVILLYKRFRKLKHLSHNTDSFITYLGHRMAPLLHRKPPNQNQLSLFSTRLVLKLGSS